MRTDIRNNKWYGGKSMKVCCLCGCQIKNRMGENNPAGAMWRDPITNELVEFDPQPEDVCCNECNIKYVLPGRLYKMNRGK